MSKPATIWSPRSGEGEVSNDNAGFGLLTEAGESLITEASELIMLEDSLYYPPADSVWASEAKNASTWRPNSGTGEVTSNSGDLLISTLSYLILTTGSTGRLSLGETTVTPKASTTWSENDG